MTELWDIYDENRAPTGRTMVRGEPILPGDYHIVVHVWLRTPDGRWMCSKRSPGKDYAGLWETTGGSALAGEDSRAAALRETKEELGLELDPATGGLLWSFKRADNFCDVWIFDCPFTEKDVTLQPEETCDARIFTSGEIEDMMGLNGERPGERFFWITYARALFALFDRPVYETVVLPRGTKMSDSVWDNIPAAPVDKWLWRDIFAPETKAQLALIDGEGLAVRMTCRESDPVARHTEYGDEVWVDSAMECFLAVEPCGKYINIEMNSVGNKLVGVGAGRDGREFIDAYFPCPPVKAEVGDGVWTVETFYKKSDLDRVFGDFPCSSGAVLYGNFFKVGEHTGKPHYGMWSPIAWEYPDFHRPEFFSKIIFK